MRYVDWVTVYPSSITLQTGHWYYGAWAEVCPPYADNTDVEWYSNNTYVASVNAVYGYIYANNPGTARIYARATDGSGASGYLTVTVRGNIYVSSVELNRTSMSLERGQSSTLTATVCPTNATNPAICWRSTNTAVATVSDGVVTARGTGTAYIYAEAADGNGAYDRCHVTVTGDILATSVRVRPASMTLTAGFSDYVHAEVCPEDTTDPNVEWYSSDESVATVNADSGLVVAQGAGTATITARVTDGRDVRGECLLTVNLPVPVTGIEVCPESLTMNVGEERDLYYNICPGNATNQSVIWCSSNENVATVGLRSGRVYAHKAGTTTITATTADGGFAVSCVIRVVIDFVTIKKDGYYFNVCFKKGLIWKSVEYDLSNYDSLPYIPQEASNRNSYNLTQLFTVEQLAFLYLLDPLGVANYLKKHFLLPGWGGKTTIEALRFKDNVFKEIFGVKPQLFRKMPDDTVLYFDYSETITDDFRESVYSTAEIIFGEHIILDKIALCSFALDIITGLFKMIPGVQESILGIEMVQALFFSGAIKETLSSGAAIFLEEYVEETHSLHGEFADIDGRKMHKWTNNLLGVLGVFGSALVDLLQPPNFNDIIIYNKVNTCNFATNFIIAEEQMPLESIIDCCQTY